MRKRLVKTIHLVGTLWFGACAVYLLTVGLRRAGVTWWAIFSLSGPSLAVAFVLTSLYLYALYRGATQSDETVMEHPLTSSAAYMMFYYSCPFLGGIGAAVGLAGTAEVWEYLAGTALGTVGATFVVWVAVDPVLGLVESMLPEGRRLRRERLACARADKEKAEADRQALLQQLEEEEEEARASREGALRPLVEELAGMLAGSVFERPVGQERAVDIGLCAWRLGGLDAMIQLHEMVLEHYRQEKGREPYLDVVALWWDEIGTWKAPVYLQEGRMGDD
jgi:hypothetical protein